MFSVIISTYNRLDLVRRAIDSVLQQVEPPSDLVVVDDGSEDATAETIADQYGGRLRVLRTEHRGVSAARNAGVRAAAYEWIAFLDSDDQWLPTKLVRQKKLIREHPEVAICQTEEIWIRNGRRVNSPRHHRKPSGEIFEACLRLCLVSPSAVVMRRSLFERCGGFDESLAACEDYDLWLRIAAVTPIWLVPEPLVVRHAGHPDQLSRRYWGMDRFRVAALLKLLASADLPPAQRQSAQAVLAEKCQILSAGALRRGRLEEADRYLRLGRLYS